MRPYSLTRRPRRGSALVITLIFGLALVVVVISLMSRVTSSGKIGASFVSTMRANNAVDATIDYGIAQIVARKATAAVDGDSVYVPGGEHELLTPDESVFAGEAAGLSRFDFSKLSIVGTKLSWRKQSAASDPMAAINNGKWYIDPAALTNAQDPLRGQYVDRYLMGVAAKGVVTSGEGSKEAFAMAFMERRDAYLFNYAVYFTANPLRIRTVGGTVTMGGAVYANQGIFLFTQSDSDIRFTGTISSATGFWNRDPDYLRWDSVAGAWDMTQTPIQSSRQGQIRFTDSTGALTSLQDTSATASPYWISSDTTGFANRATNLTGGVLKTSDHGIQSSFPMGVSSASGVATVVDPKSRETAYDTPGSSGSYNLNTERMIDEPRAGVLDMDSFALDSMINGSALKNSAESLAKARYSAMTAEQQKATDYSALVDSVYGEMKQQAASAQTIEQGKIALKASLYVVVQNDGTAVAFNNPDSALAYKQSGDRAGWRAANPDKILDLGDSVTTARMGEARYDADGNPLKRLPTRTLYDNQQGGTVSLVDVDLGALKKSVASGAIKYADGHAWNVNDSATNRKAGEGSGRYANADSLRGWNGLMYVDVEKPALRIDGIPSFREWTTGVGSSAALADTGYTSVRVVNAKEVPGATVGGAGFTLATNAAVYVKGSFNADGDLATGSSSLQDDQSSSAASTKTVAAAIWADYVVAQSETFDPVGGLTITSKPVKAPAGMTENDLKDGAWPFNSATSPSFNGSAAGDFNYRRSVSNQNLEISAAIVSGDRAGKLNSTYSGPTSNGLQSFVAFMEQFDRSNTNIRVRGSMVNLWQPKNYLGNFSTRYYWNPIRDFGYSSLFARGIMPPGTPAIRDYRKIRYLKITPGEYASIVGETDPMKWADYIVKSRRKSTAVQR